jgi:formate/nitrite transporter FocA (FNT family)
MGEGKSEAVQRREVDRRSAPSGKIVYRAILNEGDEELGRRSWALFWSGLAAGLSMGFSLIAEALLRQALPDEPWRPLISKMGYSVGFLIVVLGRQQLFTENTLTAILPLFLRKDLSTLLNVTRLWVVVLAANLLGALIIAWGSSCTSALEPAVRREMIAIGREAMAHGAGVHLLRGVFAGWLIALMVWLLPFAESGRVGVIIIITYMVGLGHFSHVIAGASDVFVLAWNHQAGWGQVVMGFLLPTLGGNIIGGVLLVAALNHGQVVGGNGGEREEGIV